MGLTAQILNKLRIQRALPPPQIEGLEQETIQRGSRYGDGHVISIFPNDVALADEGSLFVASTAPGQAALQAGIFAAFSALTPQFVVYNGDTPGPQAKRVMLRKLKLRVLTVGTSGVDFGYAVLLDPIARIPSTLSPTQGFGPGTAGANTGYRAFAMPCNSDQNNLPVGQVYFTFGTTGATGGMTVPAASANMRVIVGNGFLKSTALVAKDVVTLMFGSADDGGVVQGASASAHVVDTAPPVIIGAGHTALIYLWSTSNITAGNAFDDAQLVFAER